MPLSFEMSAPVCVLERSRLTDPTRDAAVSSRYDSGWSKQLPVPLGDDFDGVVDHFDGGLVVNCVPGTGTPAAHFSALTMEWSGIAS
jgi:hypothetical protein